MNICEYYQSVWPVLRNSFRGHARFFIATHKPDLLARGWNPYTHPLVEVLELPEDLDKDNPLQERSCQRGYEVFLPIVGRNNDTLLAPFDYEVFLEGQNHKIYTEKEFQQEILLHHIKPLSDILEKLCMANHLPYLLDYTPSGFHQLFLLRRGTRAWDALVAIGCLEGEMERFIATVDADDVKRKVPVDREIALAFSGLGKIADYLSLQLVQLYNAAALTLPATVCDSAPQCINIDQSWAGDSAIMRCLRSPASAHRKNNDKYGLSRDPLVDVIYSQFDGHIRTSLNRLTLRVEKASPAETDLAAIIAAMWDVEQASRISSRYSGSIPEATDALADFVERYKQSPLYLFHQDFEHKENLRPGEGLYRFFHDPRLSMDVHNMLYQPVPTFLQPMSLRRFVKNCLEAGWHPKHIGNGIHDIYVQNPFPFPFHKYPPETKANFYARIFSALALIEQGNMQF